jgi:hypothetical protein
MSEKIEQFTKALTDISYCRAGWDVQLSPDRRAEENRMEKEALSAARSIWAENPEIHDDLRFAFKELAPLATMDEIERAARSTPETVA